MNIKRCDTCGKIYDYTNVDAFIQEIRDKHPSGYYEVYKITNETSEYPDLVDMCPNCMYKFINWMENSETNGCSINS